MAARENQGLQIALIVFVTLTVLLSLTTFVFFRNYQSEQQKSKSESDRAAKVTQDMTKLQGERDDLIKYIGFPATEKHDAVSEAWDKEMKASEPLLGKNLPDDQKNYRKLMEGLQSVVRSQNTQLAKKDLDLRDAKEVYDRKTTEYEQEKDKLTKEKTEAVEAYLAERKRINTQLDDLTVSKTKLAAEKAQKDKDLQAQKEQSLTKINELEKSLADTQKTVLLRTDEAHKLKDEFNVNAQPDGKILWVNQRDNIAYINLGSSDRLRKRVTFSVFDPSTTDVSALEIKESTVSQARRKGVIEVIAITQPRMAECRILQHSTSNPMLPGDLIYTPLWQPGQQDHFAFAGFLDIDGDGQSDRQKIHDIIRINGGILDAEVDDKGNVQGAITHLTRYLVKGDFEPREGVSPAGGAKLFDDAARLGVENVSLSKFLDMLGYAPPADDQLLAPGRSSRLPTAGEPVDNFRPRSPPQRGNASGASRPAAAP